MKLAASLEETLNGQWRGLHGEVVTADCYRLRQLDFVPDIVFDIGANVGTFTRHARSIWPKVKIVAVEPNALNCAHFRKFTDEENVTLIQAAIGIGPVFHGLTSANGAGEVYLSCGLGYPDSKMAVDPRMEPSDVPTLTLDNVIIPHWKPSLRAVLKVDCEGAENSIWTHEPSMTILCAMDYIAMEIHRYATDGGEQDKVNLVTNQSLKRIAKNHVCDVDGVHFYARLKYKD